jgi:predicted nucleic acid-binding protein
VRVPAIANYEARRELLRAGKSASINRLDIFIVAEPDRYVPLTDADLYLAAQLWAESRRRGLPTSDPKELDVDVILAAQALNLGVPPDDLVVATTNVRHLSRFVNARLWTDISPGVEE